MGGILGTRGVDVGELEPPLNVSVKRVEVLREFMSRLIDLVCPSEYRDTALPYGLSGK